FFKTDYRGITVYLEDLPDLAATLGLRGVPHWTTLHKAAGRLLRRRRVRRLLRGTVRRFLGRRRRVPRAAPPPPRVRARPPHASAGAPTTHSHAPRRTKGASGREKVRYRRFAKLEAAFDCETHLILGAIPRRGPAVDVDRFIPLLAEALQQVKIGTALGHAGVGSGGTPPHRREQRGGRSGSPATDSPP